MANTLSVMTNALRNVVSKQRIRYKEKGFNLDLAYICDNIIAMGYPADSIESIYRNRLEDVYKFLEENHHGHYKIYNLCLERSYDISKFHGRVSVYPFEDHNPPTIELIQKFCNDVDTWLKGDSLNVAAVHCKAGKGRTGTMICCYLLYSGQQRTAEEALSCYDEKRTKDRKGVTIPSQRRYVQYFSKLTQSGLPYEKRSLQFCEIRFTEANLLVNQGTVHCSISALQDTSSPVKVQLLQNFTMDFRKSFTLDLRHISLSVSGDIKVELTHKSPRKKIFHFWFNTFFVCDTAVIESEGNDKKIVYTLNKYEIDDAHKDKEHKSFSEDFKVQLVFYDESVGMINEMGVTNLENNHRTSQSTHSTHNFTLPENSSSGSDLNYICDQKSSSSASANSLVGTGSETIGYVAGTGQRNLLESHSQLGYNSVSNNCYNDRTVNPGAIVPPLPMSPPPSYANFNDISIDLRRSKSKNLPPEHQDHFSKTSVTATSTPNQKHRQKTLGAYSIGQRQQQYQPSVSVPKVSRCTNISSVNTSAQSNSQAHITSHTSNSSKSSSISSSHSSSSATGDNEEDWESVNTHIIISPVSGPIPPVTKLLPNYVLLPSAKDVSSHPYNISSKQRTVSNGISATTKCIYNDVSPEDKITAVQDQESLPSSGNVVLLRHHSNLPLVSIIGSRAFTTISKNIKPRPRRETT